tara:strand:- start:230 stop:1102 length:873 start_codon:yes stop_codon:yes gene_type:complete
MRFTSFLTIPSLWVTSKRVISKSDDSLSSKTFEDNTQPQLAKSQLNVLGLSFSNLNIRKPNDEINMEISWKEFKRSSLFSYSVTGAVATLFLGPIDSAVASTVRQVKIPQLAELKQIHPGYAATGLKYILTKAFADQLGDMSERPKMILSGGVNYLLSNISDRILAIPPGKSFVEVIKEHAKSKIPFTQIQASILFACRDVAAIGSVAIKKDNYAEKLGMPNSYNKYIAAGAGLFLSITPHVLGMNYLQGRSMKMFVESSLNRPSSIFFLLGARFVRQVTVVELLSADKK